MKLKFLITLSIILFSCKDKSKEITKENIQINSYLTVRMKAKVLENDKFDVFFSEFITEQYHPDDKVQVNVQGKKEFQIITFKLPEKAYPIKLRLDIGSKNYTTPIKIETITLTTGDKSRIFEGAELEKYFKPNKYVKKQIGINSYSREIVNGIYDPFLVSINIDEIVTNLFNDNDAQ